MAANGTKKRLTPNTDAHPPFGHLVWGSFCQVLFSRVVFLLAGGSLPSDRSLCLTSSANTCTELGITRGQKQIRVGLAGCAGDPVTALYAVGVEPDHDAVMRIGGKSAMVGPFFSAGSMSHGATAGNHHLGSLAAHMVPKLITPATVCQLLPRFGYPALRSAMPSGTTPWVTHRHRAIKSLRASATIISLRTSLRPSLVRLRYHWAMGLSA
jgi:hypothetical protein